MSSKSIAAIRKEQLPGVIPLLIEWWERTEPGAIVYATSTSKWWACAGPPWAIILDNLDETDIEPKNPRRWLKSVGVPLEKPSARAKAVTHELYALGQALLAAVDVRMQERPAPDHEQRFADIVGRALGEELDVAIDLETTGLDPDECEIVGVSIATGNGTSVVEKDYFPWSPWISACLVSLDQGVRIIGWNSEFDEGFFLKHDCPLYFTEDAKILAWLTNVATILGLPTGGEEGRAPSLKEMATAVLGAHGVPFKKMLKAYDADDIRGVPWVAQRYYGTNDAEWTLRLFYYLESLAADKKRYPRLEKIYRQELALFPVVRELHEGLRIDRKVLKRHRIDTLIKREKIRLDILRLGGFHPVIASREEITAAVYRDHPPTQFTETKNEPALNKAALKELDTPLANLMLELSAVNKQMDSYYDPLWARGKDRIKPDWRSFGTWSGRFSGNAQQLPGEMKDMFIPDQEDHVLVVADYGQLELRIAASCSGDQHMIDILNDPERSIHTEVQQMFNIEKKQHAKNLNFGAIYGGEKTTLARQSGTTEDEAAALIAQHKREFPDLYRFRVEWINTCRRRQASTTMDGHVRLLPNLMSRDRRLRSEAERQAFNHLCQGTAGGIIKKCMYDMWIDIKKMATFFAERGARNPHNPWTEVRLLVQLHDELVYTCPTAIVDDFMRLLQQTGETDVLAPVKLVFEPAMGFNWKEAKGD